ncbi:hypothetical protein IQ07DRAFT_496646 [Pyrenochaeta sp. DS3sAY3a]|nr:hypothetical protein IQ07DRAFT_496646 [Pyrenochaeta sp. DS3sAY3a]
MLVAYLWARSVDVRQGLGIGKGVCKAKEPHPKVKIVSVDPFIAHITDFVSESEREYLMVSGSFDFVSTAASEGPSRELVFPLPITKKPLLAPSTYADSSGTQSTSSYRTSSSAFLPPSDPCVSRLAARAADFQGYLSPADINIQLTAYQPGQQYKHHYDYFTPAPGAAPHTRNTLSTFFAILHATCDDCGTEFPFVNASARGLWDGRWCHVIDCSKSVLTTRNVPGSALFWVNLDQDGRGRKDVLHAGLPARGGEKVGLNVWTDVDVGEVRERGVFGGSLKPPGGRGSGEGR